MTLVGANFELGQFVVGRDLLLPEGGPMLLDKMTYSKGYVRFGGGGDV